MDMAENRGSFGTNLIDWFSWNVKIIEVGKLFGWIRKIKLLRTEETAEAWWFCSAETRDVIRNDGVGIRKLSLGRR